MKSSTRNTSKKNSRLQNLKISQLKARIRSSEEEIKYYTEQIRNLAADPDVRNLEEKIKNNAGICVTVICRKKGYWKAKSGRFRLNWIR